MDNIVPSTPEGDDTISEETGDSICTVEQGVKDADTETVVQVAPDSSETPVIHSAVDLSTANGLSLVDPTGS